MRIADRLTVLVVCACVGAILFGCPRDVSAQARSSSASGPQAAPAAPGQPGTMAI